MLVDIVGNIGSGKTQLFTAFLLHSQIEFYSNIKIESERYNKLEVDSFFNLPDKVDIGIDEAYVWIDSRAAPDMRNKYISHILLQRRKRDSVWYTTEPEAGLIDVRFRTQCDLLVYCKARPYPYTQPVDFTYYGLNRHTGNVNCITLPYEKADVYWNRFDTSEIVKELDSQAIEYQMIKNNPDKIKNKVKEIWQEIRHTIDETTRDTVGLALMLNGYYHKYSRWVYLYAKGKIKFEDYIENNESI